MLNEIREKISSHVREKGGRCSSKQCSSSAAGLLGSGELADCSARDQTLKGLGEERHGGGWGSDPKDFGNKEQIQRWIFSDGWFRWLENSKKVVGTLSGFAI
jgi:hypothetical protein